MTKKFQAAFYTRVVALLLLFWTALLLYHFMLPPLEGTDEYSHFGYVNYLRQYRHIPALTEDNPLVRQEVGQPPLYYILGFLWSHLETEYDWQSYTGELPLNPWVHLAHPATSTANINTYLLGRNHIPFAGAVGIERANQWLRYPSLFMGMITFAVALAAARLLFPPAWALLTVVVFGFTTTLIYVFTYFTNDAPVIMLGTMTIYGLMRVLRHKPSHKTILIIALLIATGLWIKASMVIFVPALGLTLLLRFYGNKRQFIEYSVLAGLIILCFGMAWYVYMSIRYGDPLGTAPHFVQKWAKDEVTSYFVTLFQFFDRDALTLRSLWGMLTESFIDAGWWIYAAPLLLVSLSAWGYIRYPQALWKASHQIIIVLTVTYLAMLAAFIHWMRYFDFLSARLTFPAHLALVLLIMLGIYGGLQRLHIVFRASIGAIIIFIAIFISGFITYIQIFSVITLPLSSIPPLSGERFQLGDIEFLGYALHPTDPQPTDDVQMTLCWRSLSPQPIEVPYIVAVNVVDNTDKKYFRYESYSAGGSYTYWQPARAFCETVDLIAENTPARGYSYAIRLDLLNSTTLEPLTAPERGSSIIGYLTVQGMPRTREPIADFQGIYLLDYTVADAAANQIAITLDWGTGAWTPQPVTLFIHVMQNDELVEQLDVPLGVPDYPAIFWGQNRETIQTLHNLRVPSDDYQIYLGLYNTDTLQRLTVNAEQVSDNRFLLTHTP
jgi:hypothetical protein